jgi:hypothetical protein
VCVYSDPSMMNRARSGRHARRKAEPRSRTEFGVVADHLAIRGNGRLALRILSQPHDVGHGAATVRGARDDLDRRLVMADVRADVFEPPTPVNPVIAAAAAEVNLDIMSFRGFARTYNRQPSGLRGTLVMAPAQTAQSSSHGSADVLLLR